MTDITYKGLTGILGVVTVADTSTASIDDLIDLIATDEGLDTNYYQVSAERDPNNTLSSLIGDSTAQPTLDELGIGADDLIICTANQVGTKEERQIQKLDIAQCKRNGGPADDSSTDYPYYRILNEYNRDSLPTKYVGNSVVDNANVGGLPIGRPWIGVVTSTPTPFDYGTTVTWTDNTYFDSFTSQSGVTTTDGTDTNNLCWQLYYAHQALTIPADAVNRLGINTWRSGSNVINWRYAISTVDETLGSFAADAQFANQSFSYTAGGFNEQAADSSVTIPANRYFLIGVVGGPYYRATKLLASNRTAYIGGTPYVTVFNTFYQSGWPSGPTTGIPTDLGGSATFTKHTDRVSVTSIKFKV